VDPWAEMDVTGYDLFALDFWFIVRRHLEDVASVFLADICNAKCLIFREVEDAMLSNVAQF
jgi:hypothetical protein